jgi:hypothetical protein
MTTKVAELEAKVRRMEAAMEAAGIKPPAELMADEDRPDYIELGSPEHATFLGIIEVTDEEEAQEFITHQSRDTGKTYRLMDELTGFVNYPDPDKAARLVLRQKVSSLESGPPAPPTGAPPLWRPADMR